MVRFFLLFTRRHNCCRSNVLQAGAAAYTGLNRTDPDAIWSFQGWAFISWTTPKQGSYLKGFVEATPPGKFVVIDMSTNGEGEWRKWNNASFFGGRYIWTSLHDFGGTDGMKGDLSRVSNVGFFDEEQEGKGFWGTGFTPEGIDQNPVYYDFLLKKIGESAKRKTSSSGQLIELCKDTTRPNART